MPPPSTKEPLRSEGQSGRSFGSPLPSSREEPTAEALRLRLKPLSEDELDCLKPLEWLVQGLIPLGGLVTMFGKEGLGKTQVALDLAASVSTGREWLGRKVLHQGSAVYVIGEGPAGMRSRKDGWKKQFQVQKLPSLYWVREAVDLLDGQQVSILIEYLLAVRPAAVLLVIDTLARAMVAGDEDRAQDMGKLVQACDRIRASTGVTVLLLHHPTKKQPNVERGSGALAAAVDTRLKLSARGASGLTLTCLKQREGAEFDPIGLTKTVVPLGDGSTTCVVTHDQQSASAKDDAPRLNASQSAALLALRAAGAPVGIRKWRELAVKRSPGQAGLSEGNFFKIARELSEGGFALKTGLHNQTAYEVTARGTIAVAMVPLDC